VDEVLDIVGLTNVAHKRAGTFSTGMGQRLGIAAALLGDPGILLFDEPVNGLDPDGILWVRNLFKSLAAQGRTIFVSSHLMSEMALTADHVVVIGRGRLIAEAPVTDFVAQSSKRYVRVRSPKLAELGRVLTAARASVATEDDGALAVRGLAEADIGELAARSHLVLHELSPQSASLEEAFMELTAEAVEYGGNGKAVASSGSETDAGQLVPAGK
jgi:ABC-2 type transport system ATP-binding protein